MQTEGCQRRRHWMARNSWHVQQPQGTLGRREWIGGWKVRRVLTYSRIWGLLAVVLKRLTSSRSSTVAILVLRHRTSPTKSDSRRTPRPDAVYTFHLITVSLSLTVRRTPLRGCQLSATEPLSSPLLVSGTVCRSLSHMCHHRLSSAAAWKHAL